MTPAFLKSYADLFLASIKRSIELELEKMKEK